MFAPKLPPPPVPQRLRELLRDYPEYIETLQNDLNTVIEKPAYGVSPFDRAIWMLEGALGTFIGEARTELQAAEAGGNAQAIAKAKAKLDLMFDAHSSNGGMRNLHELKLYFDANKRAIV